MFDLALPTNVRKFSVNTHDYKIPNGNERRSGKNQGRYKKRKRGTQGDNYSPSSLGKIEHSHTR